MLKRFTGLVLVSSLSCSTSLLAFNSEDCSAFLEKKVSEQVNELYCAQDRFIESLGLHEHGTKFLQVMKDGTQKKEYIEMPLSEFPDAVRKNYSTAGEDIVRNFEQSILDVDAISKCHGHHRLDSKDQSVLKWRYYRIKDTDNPFVGYVKPDPKVVAQEGRKAPLIGHVTDPDSCSAGKCELRDIDLKDIQKDAVRLVYRVEYMTYSGREGDVTTTEAVTPPGGGVWPKSSILTSLKLKKTGEVFTDPEIYFLLTYYKNGKVVRVDSVDIDWANQKGINKGEVELLVWKEADSVDLVLMERDVKIPVRGLLKAVFTAIDLGLKLSGIEEAWVKRVSAGSRLSKGSDEQEGLVEWLNHVQEDDFLDNHKLMRTNTDTSIYMNKSNNLELKHTMYSEEEKVRHQEL